VISLLGAIAAVAVGRPRPADAALSSAPSAVPAHRAAGDVRTAVNSGAPAS